MTQTLDTNEFVKDYRKGLRDREILLKYGLTPKQMIQLVKKLINEGVIAREDYFNRTRTIKRIQAGEEQEFLKSLHQCPVCGHLHPVPFVKCPACGSDLAQANEMAVPAHSDADAATERAPGPDSRARLHVVPKEAGPQAAGGTETSRQDEGPALTEAHRRMIGMGLEETSYVSWLAQRLSQVDYRITDIISSGSRTVAFKAEDPEENAPSITVKVFNPDIADLAHAEAFINRLFTYQSNMKDPNAVRAVGTAVLDGAKVILYEHLPLSMEDILRREPSGLPMDLIVRLLSQMLNGLGYAHLHRGRDGVVRRIPHLNLRPSKFLMDAEMNVVKIDDCGVMRALFAVRGPRKHLWEEIGTDLGSLAPEAFVMETRSLDLLLVDLYALGAVLYRLATGTSIFNCANMEEYKFSHLKKYPVPPRVHRYDIPRWLDTMILKCLEKDPEERWRSATQMELAVGKG